MTTIGLISDTHKLLRPEALFALEGVDLIVHAGDIGSQEVIDGLCRVAPVRAIKGNIDKADWAASLPDIDVIPLQGKALYVIHNINELVPNPVTAGLDAVIFGHSHRPTVYEKEGIFYVNPGSAGPRRFSLPITLARMDIRAGVIQAEIVELLPSR